METLNNPREAEHNQLNHEIETLKESIRKEMLVLTDYIDASENEEFQNAILNINKKLK